MRKGNALQLIIIIVGVIIGFQALVMLLSMGGALLAWLLKGGYGSVESYMWGRRHSRSLRQQK